MNNSFVLVDDSSDDESIFVNHGLSQSNRKNVIVIDSSDDEVTPHTKTKNAMHDSFDSDSSDDGAPSGRSASNDDDLTDKMNKLTMESEESAWAYNKKKDEFHLDGSKFKIVDVTWPDFSLPAKLFESLYPHQKVGVQWAASMHSNKIGGIL